jgi:CRISPR/Cas system-associated endonuclease Cas3-HD
MDTWAELWAKRPANPNAPRYEETLVGHAQRVCEAAETLADMLAPKMMEIARWEEIDAVYWKKAVSLGAWMHDWGKANDHFQKMLRDTSFRQGIRHETLTLMLAQELETWLDPLWREVPAWVRCAVFFSAIVLRVENGS